MATQAAVPAQMSQAQFARLRARKAQRVVQDYAFRNNIHGIVSTTLPQVTITLSHQVSGKTRVAMLQHLRDAALREGYHAVIKGDVLVFPALD